MTVGVGKRYFKEVKMDKQIKMSASEVDLYKYIYHSNRLKHNDIELTEASLHSMNKLLGEIEKIKPTYPDKRWEFWFSVPRGTLKQYIEFNKYYDPGDCSEEKFQKDMEEEFPWKHVWFKIGVINENGYVMVFLDDTVLVRRSPDMKGDFFPDSRLDRILEFLSQVVANTVGMLKQGVYNDYVKKGLPYENRKGFINRALYWKLVPKSKRHDRDGLKEKEIDKLVAHIKAGNDLFATKAAGRYDMRGCHPESITKFALIAMPLRVIRSWMERRLRKCSNVTATIVMAG